MGSTPEILRFFVYKHLETPAQALRIVFRLSFATSRTG